MIDEWEDYYKILQVHFMAEPEIIKSAYLRLSKKYHPDSNKESFSAEKMININNAYAVLINPDTRKEYTLRWVEKNNEFNHNLKGDTTTQYVRIAIEPAQSVLHKYLTAILKQEFEVAYELITDHDKRNISENDFRKWQILVGNVFKLLSFTCAFHSMFKEIKVTNCYFETCIKMYVKVVEENLLMGRIEEDELYKNVVYENEEWRIYLGYTSLKGIIDKFNTLARLSKQKMDSSLYGKPLLQNKKDFIEMAWREQMRHNRYGNVFSLIKCNIDHRFIEDIERVMDKQLRKLDFTCRWNNNTQLILLPETDEKAALIVANKIKQSLEENFNSKKVVPIAFKIMQQRFATLDELMIKVLE